jgi:hypothetical protein
MRFGAKAFLSLSVILSLTTAWGIAQEAPPSEYRLKAAFLFNFAKFVDWPPEAFKDASAPLVIGILGDNPFGRDLEQTVQGKSINTHPLLIKQFSSPSETTNCHILFVSSSEKKRQPEVLNSVRGAPVLTVGENDQFIEAGGMINFVVEDKKIRFQINNDPARREGLKISSKLLGLAQPSGK